MNNSVICKRDFTKRHQGRLVNSPPWLNLIVVTFVLFTGVGLPQIALAQATDTIGLYNPELGRFYLKNSLAGGAADLTFNYGPRSAGWWPLVGDWNGNGSDTIGLYNPELGRFYLKNSLTGGAADLTFSYGPRSAGWWPLVGDWEITIEDPDPIIYDFNDGNAAGWAVVDDSKRASNWQVINGKYYQSNHVESRADGFDGTYHLGTYSYLNSGFNLKDYRVTVAITPLPDAVLTTGHNDVGLMFRYQDNDNYYRLSLSSRYGFTRLEKKIAGAFTTLAVDARGYQEQQTLDVTINMAGDLIQIYINGEPRFSARDSSQPSGTVALYAQGLVNFDNVIIDNASRDPAIVIATPLAYSIYTGEQLDVSAVATHVPAAGTVEFYLNGISCNPVTQPAPGLFSANCLTINPGDHTVEALLRGEQATRLASDTNVKVGASDHYSITVGDSITNGVGDNFTSDNLSKDGRIIAAQGYQAVLSDLLTDYLSYPNIVFNEGIGGDKAFDAATVRIDSILERHPNATRALVMLGTNDSGSSLPVPSGLGCSGSACNGTYKQDMQTLVNTLRAAGKQPVVALVPPVFGNGSSAFSQPLTANRNKRIQEYNQVIGTELSGIQIGPNFFSFFLNNTVNRAGVFPDFVHPNGLGYKLMGELWFSALTGVSVNPFVLDSLSPKNYLQDLLEKGNQYYIDRGYTLTSIPNSLANGIWIMTANEDMNNANDNYLSFTVNRNISVYVAYDANATALPAWLTGFIDTGLQVGTTHPAAPTFKLYQADYPPGQVVLGGNQAGGASGAQTNYVVIVVAR